MKILLIVPTLFFLSCVSGPVNTEKTAKTPWPVMPMQVQVIFKEADAGLFLSYSEYRKLEANIIELRRYIKELEAQLRYWRDEQ